MFFFLFQSVGTLIVRSLERQIVGVLIVNFHEYQQCNVRFGGGGLVVSPMIKSSKNAEMEKRIEAVRIAYLPQWGCDAPSPT